MKSHKVINNENLTIKEELTNNKTLIKVGRPSIDLIDYESELIQLFSIGGTISQVLEYLGIDNNTYYRYLNKHKAFRDKMQRARNNIVLTAKKNVADKINLGDIETSKWHLEKTEYRPKEITAFEDKDIRFVVTRQ